MLVLAALLAVVAAGTCVVVRAPLLRATSLQIENYRGRRVPAAGGLLVLVGFLAAEATLSVVALLRPGGIGVAESANLATSPGMVPVVFFSADHAGIVIAVLGFFALGLIDDTLGGSHRGLRGHAAALVRGEITGGVIKAAGGGVVALVAAGLWELRLGPALVNALVVALSANLVNLLDLRPGRATKVFLAAWLPIAIGAGLTPFLPLSAPLAASAVVWLFADLKETGMLGDSGANLLGAAAGAGVALSAGLGVRLGVLAFLAILTLVAEVWSLGNLIRRVPPLDYLDRLGRAREE